MTKFNKQFKNSTQLSPFRDEYESLSRNTKEAFKMNNRFGGKIDGTSIMEKINDDAWLKGEFIKVFARNIF